VSALEAVARVRPVRERPLDAGELARILRYGAGVLRRSPGRDDHWFRTYASAGALYPVEVYVACVALPGLDAALYHFDPRGALTVLRTGDHRGHLVHAAAGEDAMREAAAILVLTGIPWRTAWKYTERGYRHLYWDGGMILANVLALAASAEITARVVHGYTDTEIETLLGIDGRREFPLCLVALGRAPAAPAASALDPLTYRTRPLSRRELEHRAITEANDAGRISDAEAVLRWRDLSSALLRAPTPTAPPSDPQATGEAVQRVIRRRGSARDFGGAPMSAPLLADTLGRSIQGVPSDLVPSGSRLTRLLLIANAIEGMEPGAYRFGERGFELLRAGGFRRAAGYLCLEQELGAQAAATCFFMAELDAIVGTLGDRGYRMAQLEGGIAAGKAYLPRTRTDSARRG
jgi:SagB-type dehydrogenase family enzyme